MAVHVLKEELAFFEENKREWLKSHAGQFALIKGRTLIGIFPTQTEAYAEGFRRFVKEPFLVREIKEQERPEQVPLLAMQIQQANL